MRLRTPRSLEIFASVGLLLLGARCSSDTAGGADAAGNGGASTTGGTVGTGGEVGTGGQAQGAGGEVRTGGRAQGTGGTVTGSGGRAAGGASGTAGRSGRGTGGALAGGNGGRGPDGNGGQPGAGGTTSPVGPEPGRDGGPAVKRDSAPDAPTPPADASPEAGTCVPDYACKPVAPNTGDPVADCVARVNQFRACVCLPPLGRWTEGEACANQDAQYDSEQGTAHAGAQADICDWGNAQDECPDWKRATAASVIDGCLQMMFDEGPPPSGSCTGQCYEDHGHYINMTGTKYKLGVACGFYTTASGSVWATQNFK